MKTNRTFRWQTLLILSCMLPFLVTSVQAAPLQQAPEPVISGQGTLVTWGISGGFIYYCPNGQTLRRRPLNGTVVTTFPNAPCIIDLQLNFDDSGVYYFESASLKIKKIATDTPNATPITLTTVGESLEPNNLRVQDGYVYWVESTQTGGSDVDPTYRHRLKRIRTSGGIVSTMSDFTDSGVRDLGISSSYVYWTTRTGLFRKRISQFSCSTNPAPCQTQTISAEAGEGLHILKGNGGLWWGRVDNRYRLRLISCQPTCTSRRFYSSPSTQRVIAAGTLAPGLAFIHESNVLRRVDTLGVQADTLVESIPFDPAIVTIEGDYLYFTWTASIIGRIRLDADPIERDMRVIGLEITQSIQSVANDVSLVAGKTTYARLYADLADSGAAAGQVEAILYRVDENDNVIPGSRLYPLNPTSPLLPTSSLADRDRLDRGWTFLLPDEWVNPSGQSIPQDSFDLLRLRAEIDPNHTLADTSRGNNTITRSRHFNAKAPACLYLRPAYTTGPRFPVSSNNRALDQSLEFTETLLPISRILDYRNRTGIGKGGPCPSNPNMYCVLPYDLTSNSDVTDLLNQIAFLDFFSIFPATCYRNEARTYSAALVHPVDPWGSNGISRRNKDELISKVPVQISDPSDFRRLYMATSLPHELSHGYGRRHINCGTFPPSQMNFDTFYNNPCVLDDGDDTQPGTHFGFSVLAQEPIAPDAASDVMSYNGPRWMSDLTYTAVFNRVGALDDGNRAGDDPAMTLVEQAATMVVVSGVVDEAGSQSSLSHAWQYPTAAASAGLKQQWAEQITANRSAATAYQLRLRAADGTLLHAEPIALTHLTDYDAGSLTPFTLLFPAPTGQVTRMELTRDDVGLTSLTANPGRPVVNITTPANGVPVDDRARLTWTASDPEGDLLHFTVQYSPDEGNQWSALLVDEAIPTSSNSYSLALDLSSLPGSASGQARLRVFASDGYHTGSATSAPFSVAKRGPQPVITAPAAGQWFAATTPIVARGRVEDAEDTPVANSSMRWSGAAPGGVGAIVGLEGLAPGEYTLTLEATDQDGQSGSDSLIFHIAPLEVANISAAQLALDGGCDDPGYESAATIPLAPRADGSRTTLHLVRTSQDLWACFSGLAKGAIYAGLTVDGDNSREPTVQPADRAFFIRFDGTPVMMSGQGGVFNRAPFSSDMTARLIEFDTVWSAELKIDRNAVGGWDNRIGLGAIEYDESSGETVAWPWTTDRNTPNRWAQVNWGLAPQINSVEPSTFNVGDPATAVTVTGTSFDDDSQVAWQGTPLAITLVNGTTLQATVEAGLLDQGGSFSLEVVNTAAPNLKSLPYAMTIINPQPAINAISPDTADANDSALTLTVAGSNFVEGALLYWNDRSKPTTFINATELQATITPTDLVAGGVIQVRVINPEPNSGVSNALNFTVTGSASPPHVRLYLPVVIK